MTAALYFHPEAYTTSGPKLMGRNAAGESFLRGYLKHSAAAQWWVQVERAEHGQAFADAARAAGRGEPVKVVTRAALSALGEAGAVYFPGPGIGVHAWQRGAVAGAAAWSLCGITHTTSSAGAMDAIAEWLTAPVQPWDAVICTSAAVKDHVSRLLAAQQEHLAQRLGAQRWVLPQLPVIPLGIHTQDFVFGAERRAAARAALGVDARTHVVLYMGRLSFHAKAHPLALYQALQQAAQRLPDGQRVLLLECGWHANEYIAKAYADAATAVCPNVEVRTLDGRSADARNTAWAGADVFCSLSDNIQETFGITPIEAMAAGLPVVVSDWDGYRDTVRDGVDGFRVPTLMPQAGLAGDLALRHALEVDTYDMYCGHTCSLVAVDVAATAHALAQLFLSEDLRQRMGAQGRQRAQEVFDWAVIIPQYEALWQQLGVLRQNHGPAFKAPAHPWPARMDPFAGFASYPTVTLTPQTVLALALPDRAEAVARVAALRSLAMVSFAPTVLPSPNEVEQVLAVGTLGPQPALAWVQSIADARKAQVFRALAWLVKLGVLKVC